MKKISLLFFIIVIFAITNIRIVQSATIGELRAGISDRESAISEIEKEIAEQQKQLNGITTEKKGLEREVATIDLSRRRLLNDIRVTQEKIGSTELTIEKLSIEIGISGQDINKNNDVLAETLRNISESDDRSLVEVVLSHDDLSEVWDEIDDIERLQSLVRDNLDELYSSREDMIDRRSESEDKKQDLRFLTSDLSDQKKVVEKNKEEKDYILTITKNKESAYQDLLDEKIAKRKQFEQELFAFEADLKAILDPDTIPQTQPGVLQWPLTNVRITQYFGNTPFASKNPSVYNGSGHNGIDFGIARGTRVKSALSGTIIGTGDTDNTCRGASYGKWVLVRHNNGLATLYAHLSLISVVEGQTVATGETVGFSGNTGYSTGPHLHFTVFASAGVKVGNLKSRACGTTYTLPLPTSKGAYLNPLSYLPSE